MRMTDRLGAVAVAAVALLYGRAWAFTLQCDDLVFIRPWSAAELTAVWHGTWEPQHALAVFFRPLVSWFFAGTFELFGVNAHAHMLVSMALFALVAWALGAFVRRESGSTTLAALAIVIFVLHPNTVWSSGVWVTNSTHKLAALWAFAALFAWHRVRQRGLRAWWPVALAITASFLCKEDALMLIPAILTAQWMRARLVGDVRRPGGGLLAAGATLAAGLVLWRTLALGEMGGFLFSLEPGAIARNIVRGPLYVASFQGTLAEPFSWPGLVAAVVCALVIGAIMVRVLRTQRDRQWPVALALVIAAWYNVPLTVISNSTRYYMLTACGALVLAAAVEHLWTARRTSTARIGVATLVGLVAVYAVSVQQRALTMFAPCGAAAMDCRAWTLEMLPLLPPEARALTLETGARCAAGRAVRLDREPMLTWGLGGASLDTDTGATSRVAADHVVALLDPTATSTTLHVRHPAATAATPVDVEIGVDGRQITRLHLTSDAWVSADVPLTNNWRTWLRAMHRADVRVTAGGIARAGLEWRAVAPHH